MNKLVIDVGGTFIKYAWMNEKAEILEKGKVQTPLDQLDSLLNVLTELWEKRTTDTDGIALSMPGLIDGEKGYMYTGGALTYIYNLDLVSILEERFHCPVSLENDAKCAALAEVWKGNLLDCESGIVLVCGTAIGGAIVQKREVLRGEHVMAGEFSYIQTAIDDKNFDLETTAACQCGAKGLTQLAADRYGVSLEEAEITYTGEKLFELANAGDEKALDAIRVFSRRLAIIINNLQFILDPQRFLIGGGISIQPLFLKLVKEELKKIRDQYHGNLPLPEITTCQFYNDANLIGAMYWWQKQNRKIDEY